MKVKQTLELDINQLKELFGKYLGVEPGQIRITSKERETGDFRESWKVFDGLTVSFDKEVEGFDVFKKKQEQGGYGYMDR